jgi:hypothetical protein
MDYDPSSLPAVDVIEIVDLRGVDPNRISEFMKSADSAPRVRCDASTAATIADAWRSLPAGDSARCHTPPIGLRFFCNSRLCLEASVCWQCHNFYATIGEKQTLVGFERDSEGANRLLKLVQQAIGAETVGDG